MELHYNVEMFQELAELIENVKYEIRKKFKLSLSNPGWRVASLGKIHLFIKTPSIMYQKKLKKMKI